MFAKYLIPLVALIPIVSASAGQIQIGGASGLTASYLTSTVGPVTGSTGGWGERSYVAALFNAATVSSPVSDGASALPMTDTVVAGTPGVVNKMVDDNLGITYNLVEDGMGSTLNGNNNHVNSMWASVNGAGTMIVPIDIADADWVGIMVNDYWGFSGANPTFTFNFLTAGAVAVTLSDTPGGAGPIRASTDCTSVTGTGTTCPGATTGGHGNVTTAAPITSVSNSGGITTLNSGIQVTASTIWYGNYATNSTSVIGPYRSSTGGSAGNVILDDLKFNLGAFSTDTLLSISFTQNSVAIGNNISRLAVGAITVDSQAAAATPEPSTVVLFAVGFGLILLGSRRLRRA